MSHRDVLNVAIDAARRAGHILLESQHGARHTVEQKANLVDLVTATDKAAEAEVVAKITASFPDDGVVGEEGANRPAGTNRRWIIDPLDGTSNFIRRWKMSATSIGVEIDGQFTVGVVFNPFTDELFSAVTGQGAWLNGEQIRIASPAVPLAGAFVGMDGGYMPWARSQRAYVAAQLLQEAGEFRYGGSTALDLCHVAMGRLDGHVNIGSSIWDIAAGTVIAREAGCVVEGLAAGSEPTAHHTIAGRPELIEDLRRPVTTATQMFETGPGPGEE